MKIIILGTGGVGGYFGARLVPFAEVTFLARGAHAAAMQEKGLHVESVDGNFWIQHPTVVEHLEDLGHKYDLIMVSVKSYQLKELIPQIPQLMHEESLVWPLLNGISAEEKLAEIVPKERIVHGLCKIFSRLKEPGVIEHFGYQPTLHFGKYFNVAEEKLQMLDELLRSSGIHYFHDEDILAEKYKKWLFICSGGLTAYYNLPYGAIVEDSAKMKEMQALFHEIWSVARANGVQLDAAVPEKTLALLKTFPYEATSSMQRDIAEGKSSELEELNGQVVKLGQQLAIPTPVNQKVYEALKARA